MTPPTEEDVHEPLISNRTLLRITVVIGLLAALTSALSIAGKWLGEDLVRGDHSASLEIQRIIVGQDILSLPSNVIRFEAQRKSGRAETVSIYLSWPNLEGYSSTNATLFSDPHRSDRLLFAEFSQSVMSRDMSGRVEPIYSKLFTGEASVGPAGLTVNELSRNSGFGDERVLTGTLPDGSIYAVRCMIPTDSGDATSADCLRDIAIGRDLTMLYRFSSKLLPQWKEIELSMRSFTTRHLVE
jgi:hypothetical protein